MNVQTCVSNEGGLVNVYPIFTHWWEGWWSSWLALWMLPPKEAACRFISGTCGIKLF